MYSFSISAIRAKVPRVLGENHEIGFDNFILFDFTIDAGVLDYVYALANVLILFKGAKGRNHPPRASLSSKRESSCMSTETQFKRPYEV